MKTQKTFFIDYDGTLFTPKQVKTPKIVLEAIQAVHDIGHKVFLATGRPYAQVPKEMRELPFDGLLLSRGAHTILGGQTYLKRPLPFEDTKAYLTLLRDNGIQYALFDDHYSYAPRNFDQIFAFYAPMNIDESLYIYDFDEDEVLPRTLKLEVMVESEAKRKIILDTVGSLAVAGSPQGKRLDVYEKGITKGGAVSDVIELLGVRLEDSYGIGDSPNDLEMFGIVGHAIATGNALETVKERAELVIGSVDEYGVADYLKQFC